MMIKQTKWAETEIMDSTAEDSVTVWVILDVINTVCIDWQKDNWKWMRMYVIQLLFVSYLYYWCSFHLFVFIDPGKALLVTLFFCEILFQDNVFWTSFISALQERLKLAPLGKKIKGHWYIFKFKDFFSALKYSLSKCFSSFFQGRFGKKFKWEK